MADNTNTPSIDLTQAPFTNTQPFDDFSLGGESISNTLANQAMAIGPYNGGLAPDITAEMDKLRIPGYQQGVDLSLPLGANMGVKGQGGKTTDLTSFDGYIDNRQQLTVKDVDVSDLYTEFTSSDWKNMDKDHWFYSAWGAGYGGVKKKPSEEYLPKNVEDARAREQGWLGRMNNGTAMLLDNAYHVIARTGVVLANIPDAIQQMSLKPLYDSDMGRFLNDFSKSSNGSNIIYHTQKYKDSSALGSVLHSEFWAEKVFPALGFTVGAVGVGSAVAGVGGGFGLGSGSVGFSTATGNAVRSIGSSVITNGVKSLSTKALVSTFRNALAKDLLATTVKGSIMNGVTLMTSAVPEAAIEASTFLETTQNNFIDSYKAEYGRPPTPDELSKFTAESTKAANGVFVANTALVGASNMMQFGDLLGLQKVVNTNFLKNTIDKAFGLGIKQTIEDVAERGIRRTVYSGMQRSAAQKIGFKVFKAMESPVMEGLVEEGLQGVISGTGEQYLAAKFDPRAAKKTKSLLQSFGDAFAHTYGTKEGWEEISIGMIVGGLGTVRRGPRGFDMFNQREASHEVAQVQHNIDQLNTTQQNLDAAHMNLLQSQSNLNQFGINPENWTQEEKDANAESTMKTPETKAIHERLGSITQNISLQEQAKAAIAIGELELAQNKYQQAVHAKLYAEKRAGLSDANKFNINMMLDNLSEDMLKNEFNFQEVGDIEQFKDNVKQEYERQVEAFDVSSQIVDNLGIGQVGNQHLSGSQMQEAASLVIYQGLMSADNANKTATLINDTIGESGLASALHYYNNLTEKDKQAAANLSEKIKQSTALDNKIEALTANMATTSEKMAREPENASIVSEVSRLSMELNQLIEDRQRLQEETAYLRDRLNARSNMPSLPYGNPATGFFQKVGMDFSANTDIDTVVGQIESLGNFISELRVVDGKGSTEIQQDQLKADTLEDMVKLYTSQIQQMRNFAKATEMLSDPSYYNKIGKNLFNNKRYQTAFDNSKYIEGDTHSMDTTVDEYNTTLQEKINSGEMSVMDYHLYSTNAELIFMTQKVNLISDSAANPYGPEVISNDQYENLFNTDGSLDLQNDNIVDIFESIVSSLVNDYPLSKRQAAIILSSDTFSDAIDSEVIRRRGEKATTIDSLGDPNRNVQEISRQRLNKLLNERIDNINKEYEDRLNSLYEQLTNQQTNPTETSTVTSTDIEALRTEYEQNMKLNGIEAVAKLNEYAIAEGLDITQMTREELVDYGISKFIKLSDSILRLDGQLRAVTGMKDYLEKVSEMRKSRAGTTTEKIWDNFSNEIHKLSGNKDSKARELFPGVRASSANVNSNSWMFFMINNASLTSEDAPHKSYFSLNKFNKNSPKQFKAFLEYLQKSGYKGSIKTFTQFRTGITLSDQFVMHGQTEEDTKIGIKAAEEFFGDNLRHTSFGKDEFEDGKAKSYSQILAEKIQNSVSPETLNNYLDSITPNNLLENSDNTVNSNIQEQIDELEKERQNRIDEVTNNVNQVNQQSSEQGKKYSKVLDELNQAIEEGLQQMKDLSINPDIDFVDTFHYTPKEIQDTFDRYNVILRGEEIPETPTEETELKDLINSYGILEGSIVNVNGQEEQILMSDLLEQRAQLEQELLDSNEFASTNNVESDSSKFEDVNEEEIEFLRNNRGGDATVLNTYDFATFTGVEEGGILISNITPSTFLETAFPGLEDALVTITDIKGNVVSGVNIGEINNLAQEGSTVTVEGNYNGSPIKMSFNLDNSKRILLDNSQYNEEALGLSNISSNEDNRIGNSAHYVLKSKVGDTYSHIASDFDTNVNRDAAQRVNPGDDLTIVFDPEHPYNKELMDKYKLTQQDISGNSEDRVQELENSLKNFDELDSIAKQIVELEKEEKFLSTEIENVNSELEKITDDTEFVRFRNEVLNPLLDKSSDLNKELIPLIKKQEELKSTVGRKSRSTVEKELTKLNKRIENKINDKNKKIFLDSMALVVKDSSGNTVGVVKSNMNTGSGLNSNKLNSIRTELFDSVFDNGFNNTVYPTKVPAQFVYLGIPNIQTNGTSKVTHNFGKDGIPTSKVLDIGVVSYNTMSFADEIPGESNGSAYNYALSLMKDETNQGRFFPVIKFLHEGKVIIYPISFKTTEKGSEYNIQRFDELMNLRGTTTNSEFINSMNTLLQEIGIGQDYRLTSLNISERMLSDIREKIQNTPESPRVIDILNSANKSNILEEYGEIDIDLQDTPFLGPKIRMDFSNIEDIVGSDSHVNTLNENTLEKEVDEFEDNNECNNILE